MLDGNVPVYLCWLRNDAGALIAIVAVAVPRRTAPTDADARSFSLAHAFLRPALECLRRDLLARAAIDDLTSHRVIARQAISSCCSRIPPARAPLQAATARTS